MAPTGSRPGARATPSGQRAYGTSGPVDAPVVGPLQRGDVELHHAEQRHHRALGLVGRSAYPLVELARDHLPRHAPAILDPAAGQLAPRYVTRPPIATQRLALAANGGVVYGLKRHWRDGTSAISFDPLTFIERLAALVPPPRAHQLTYHGVLAPASEWRDLIVPEPPPSESTSSPQPHSSSSKPARPSLHRSTWAELLRRVFAIDVLTCPHCGGWRRLIAFLTDPAGVRKILAHLGQPSEPPVPATARSAPELEFA